MVTYGRFELAREAIGALIDHTEAPDYELVVVDNSSPDGTGEFLAQELEGANLILNEDNVGFGAGANQGARAARGRLVCHLNSDAVVQPGWLPPLVATLESDPTIGAVVPMLLNRDGTVQEAGSVIDSAGWAFALGNGGKPESLELRFRRDVDFGSAACLLLRRSTFLTDGGFDSAYGTAYFEDADLCFQLAERGLRTVYEPRSRVVHIQFGSSDPEAASRRVRENRQIFFSRWHRRLSQRPSLIDLSGRPTRHVRARDAEALERVLVIDDRVPHTDRGSGDPRMAKLLLELAELWPSGRVTLFAAECRNLERYAEPLLAAGVEVACATGDYGRWFEERRFHYSAAIVSRPQNFQRFDALLAQTQPQALRVFDVEALSSRRLALAAGYAADGPRSARLQTEANRMRALEAEALQAADAIFCVTDEERALVEELASGVPVHLLSTYVEPAERPAGFEERRDLVIYGGFLGGAGSPNEDALLHLVADVLPLIRQELDDVVLHVVGADPPPSVRTLDGHGINVVGFVPDPLEWLARARIHVNPTRYGAGIKLKLIDTMAAGLPFATSSIAAEGLKLGSLAADLVADDPTELARRVVHLYRDREAWEAAQARLLEVARTQFHRSVFRAALVDAMISVGFSPPSGAALAQSAAAIR